MNIYGKKHPPAVRRLPDLVSGETRERVERELATRWPDVRLQRIWRAEGGFSNETWFVELAAHGVGQTVVLRRQALVGPLEPYDLPREAAVLTALAPTDVPVPAVELVCTDPAVAGSPFVMIERIEGEVPEYRDLPQYPRWADPGNRTAMAVAVLRALHQIQRVPVTEAPWSTLLSDPADGASAPVVARVRRLLATLEADVGADAVPPILRETAGWLLEHAPPRGDVVLVHGDWKMGNFVWRDGAIAAVLDWELAALGDSLEDLGYACHPVMRAQRPELMAMLVPFDELELLYEREFGRPLDRARLHYYVIAALYFHLYTFVTGLVAGLRGADIRVALGYAKFPLGTRELVRHMTAYEEGDHAL